MVRRHISNGGIGLGAREPVPREISTSNLSTAVSSMDFSLLGTLVPDTEAKQIRAHLLARLDGYFFRPARVHFPSLAELRQRSLRMNFKKVGSLGFKP